MRINARWKAWNDNGLEHCTVDNNESGLILSGAVVGTRGSEYGAFYFVRTDENFRTREVHIRYTCGSVLHIESDGNGCWYDLLTEVSLPTLDGCIDVDIGVTPATNTLPIKRLNLSTNESLKILTAYVPLPSQIEEAFVPMRAEQRYTCLEKGILYRYEGLFRDFTADLKVDSNDLVLDYPETFVRLLDNGPEHKSFS